MADRQTALAVFDFLDSLRAGQYRIGADAEKDHATAGLLASLSGDTGLRDAVFGSVANRLAQHASVPVTVVP